MEFCPFVALLTLCRFTLCHVLDCLSFDPTSVNLIILNKIHYSEWFVAFFNLGVTLNYSNNPLRNEMITFHCDNTKHILHSL